MAEPSRATVFALVFLLCGLNIVSAADPVGTYVVDYPHADQFVPPVEGFFEEVASPIGRVGRRTFRHEVNGGYGLAIRDRVGTQHLIHLGADVGWYRIGDPVVSVANGVVRVVQQPLPNVRRSKDKAKSTPQNAPPILQWGGVVAIEHHLPDDRYVTTVYGHLDEKLLVSKGDIVKMGQPIGRIGNTRVNGGYKPHLHFGVRDGRMAEKGRDLVGVNINGQNATLKIEDVKDEVLVLSGAESLPDQFQLFVGDQTFEVRKRNDGAEVPTDILLHIQPRGFGIVGYGLAIEGWRDPVAFLRDPQGE